MVSKTRMIELVKAFDWQAVDAALSESPELLGYRDDRERNWLHLCCATDLKVRDAQDSIRTADVLMKHGIDLADHAFTEGDWKATPVWFCVSRGKNPALAEHLLKKGANPNYSLWAAGFMDSPEWIDLLVKYGAVVEDPSVPSETPFIGAVAWSHFKAAAALARHGADVDAKNPKGMTALLMMLKKGSDYADVATLVGLGASLDVAGPDGKTPREIMARKKDPRFVALAGKAVGG